MPSEITVRSANWHLTDRCNYTCVFCFMQTLPGREAGRERGREIMDTLARLGVTKLNFVGGEPMLHPLLPEFAAYARQKGFTVSMVTNGSLLNEAKIMELRPNMDWLGISVDSAFEGTEIGLGRGHGRHIAHAREVCRLAREAGMKLKLNTVVTKLNFQEDMRPLVRDLDPLRWKVFQMLLVAGQNDAGVTLATTSEEFETFRKTNADLVLGSGQKPVFEAGEDMVDSYLMLAPDGGIIANSRHHYRFIPLKEVEARGLSGIVSERAYVDRGGVYDW